MVRVVEVGGDENRTLGGKDRGKVIREAECVKYIVESLKRMVDYLENRGSGILFGLLLTILEPN